MRCEIQLSEYRKLAEYLCAHGVELLPLKGVEIKKLYPAPALRVMSDVDLLYAGVSSKELSVLMTDFGYSQESIDTGAHDIYYKRPYMNVELHRKLVVDYSPHAECLTGVTENRIPDEQIPNLYHYRPEDLFIHVIVHAAKHLTSSGLGVRPLCDVYILNRTYASAWDREYIRRTLARGGLETFADKLTAIAQKWFGDGAPDFSQEEERFFFSGSTYGNYANSINWSYASSGKKNGFTYFLSRMFLPYSIMKTIYPVLKKWPILLPFCWVAHWIDVLLHRRNRVVAVAKTGAVPQEERDYAARILRKFGLRD